LEGIVDMDAKAKLAALEEELLTEEKKRKEKKSGPKKKKHRSNKVAECLKFSICFHEILITQS